MTTIASINCLRFGLIYYCLAFLRCTFEMIIRSKDVLLKLEARDQPSVFSNGSACNRLQCFKVKHHLSSFQHGYLSYSLRPRFSVLTNLKARVDHWSMDEKKKLWWNLSELREHKSSIWSINFCKINQQLFGGCNVFYRLWASQLLNYILQRQETRKPIFVRKKWASFLGIFCGMLFHTSGQCRIVTVYIKVSFRGK